MLKGLEAIKRQDNTKVLVGGGRYQWNDSVEVVGTSAVKREPVYNDRILKDTILATLPTDEQIEAESKARLEDALYRFNKEFSPEIPAFLLKKQAERRRAK